MACHEIAALRVGLHHILGTRPESELGHELAELGSVIETEGPLKEMTAVRDLNGLRRALLAAADQQEAALAALGGEDPTQGYQRALVVTVRAAQRDLERMIRLLEGFYLDIEDTHDLLHEVFPGSADD